MSSQAASCHFMGYPFTVIFGQLFSNPLRTSLSLSHSTAACCSSAWIECSSPTLGLLYMSDMLYYPWLRPQVSHQRICLKLITVWGWPISTQVHMAMSDFCVESQVSHSRCIAKSSSFIPDAVNRILASCYFIEVRTNDYPKSNMNQTPRTQLDDRRYCICPFLHWVSNLTSGSRGTSFEEDVLNHGYILPSNHQLPLLFRKFGPTRVAQY